MSKILVSNRAKLRRGKTGALLSWNVGEGGGAGRPELSIQSAVENHHIWQKQTKLWILDYS